MGSGPIGTHSTCKSFNLSTTSLVARDRALIREIILAARLVPKPIAEQRILGIGSGSGSREAFLADYSAHQETLVRLRLNIFDRIFLKKLGTADIVASDIEEEGYFSNIRPESKVRTAILDATKDDIAARIGGRLDIAIAEFVLHHIYSAGVSGSNICEMHESGLAALRRAIENVFRAGATFFIACDFALPDGNPLETVPLIPKTQQAKEIIDIYLAKEIEREGERFVRIVDFDYSYIDGIYYLPLVIREDFFSFFFAGFKEDWSQKGEMHVFSSIPDFKGLIDETDVGFPLRVRSRVFTVTGEFLEEHFVVAARPWVIHVISKPNTTD